MTASRYHPALVALHWVLAVLILGALYLGMFILTAIPNSSPEKLNALRAHMTGGIAIVVLMSVRFIIRMASARPPAAATGSAPTDYLAKLSHYSFYVLIALMGATGLATAVLAGLFDTVFLDSGVPLPESFRIFPTRVLHGFIAMGLLGLISLHVVAALYHQFIRKDNLLSRMWLGSRLAREKEALHSLPIP